MSPSPLIAPTLGLEKGSQLKEIRNRRLNTYALSTRISSFLMLGSPIWSDAFRLKVSSLRNSCMYLENRWEKYIMQSQWKAQNRPLLIKDKNEQESKMPAKILLRGPAKTPFLRDCWERKKEWQRKERLKYTQLTTDIINVADVLICGWEVSKIPHGFWHLCACSPAYSLLWWCWWSFERRASPCKDAMIPWQHRHLGGSALPWWPRRFVSWDVLVLASGGRTFRPDGPISRDRALGGRGCSRYESIQVEVRCCNGRIP